MVRLSRSLSVLMFNFWSTLHPEPIITSLSKTTSSFSSLMIKCAAHENQQSKFLTTISNRFNNLSSISLLISLISSFFKSLVQVIDLLFCPKFYLQRFVLLQLLGSFLCHQRCDLLQPKD